MRVYIYDNKLCNSNSIKAIRFNLTNTVLITA